MTYARIKESQLVTAGTAGTLQAVFDPPPAGLTMVVAFTIPNAEATASWGLFLGPVPGVQISTWGGNTPCSAVPLTSSEGQMAVTGAALVAGKQYIVNRTGYLTDADSAALLLPLPAPPGGAIITPPPPPVPGGSSGGGSSGPPAPPSSSLNYDPEPFPWSATGVSSLLVDVAANYTKPIYFTMSNPEGQAGVWLSYLDTPAVVNQGVYLPSPGFLLETTYLGQVYGITAGGTATGGGMVMTVL